MENFIVFGFFKKKKEDKLLEEVCVIVGKAFILQGYPSDEAHKISLVSGDMLVKNIGEVSGKPWVLAVRGMGILRSQLVKDAHEDEGTKQLIDDLKELVLLCLPNAREDADETDLMIFNAIERTVNNESKTLS